MMGGHVDGVGATFGGSATLSSPPSSISSRATVFPASSPVRGGGGGGGGGARGKAGTTGGGGGRSGAMMKNKRDSLHSSVSSEYQIPSPLGSGSVCGGAGGAGGGGGGGSGGSGGGSIDYETPPKPVVRKSSLVGVGIPTNSIKVTDT